MSKQDAEIEQKAFSQIPLESMVSVEKNNNLVFLNNVGQNTLQLVQLVLTRRFFDKKTQSKAEASQMKLFLRSDIFSSTETEVPALTWSK